MPSGHAALVGALCSAVAKVDGLGSTAFAITLLIAGLVVYDALVIRRILGAQGDAIRSFSKRKVETIVGHRLGEVIVGLVLGAIIAWFLV